MADRKFRVVVAGAGVSGLFMAETLKRARIDFTVYEKAGEVGGTWRDNTFPGLFVDVLSRQYEFPFQPNYNWSRKYAPATEIWAYIKKVTRDRGLTKFNLARLGTAFPGTVWVGGCKNWYTSQQPTPVLWPFPPRQSCGPSRRASTRRSSSRCPWTISSLFPAGRKTDRSLGRRHRFRMARCLFCIQPIS